MYLLVENEFDATLNGQKFESIGEIIDWCETLVGEKWYMWDGIEFAVDGDDIFVWVRTSMGMYYFRFIEYEDEE